jgi:hypothetical protein
MSIRKGELDDIPGLGSNSSALVEMRVEDLNDHPAHPFTHSAKDIARAKRIVDRFPGRAWPVLVDDENRVLSGGIFVAAARVLALKVIKVIRQSGLTDTEGLLLGTAISKISTLGSIDGIALEAALRSFEDAFEDFSHDLIGFAPGELDRIIGASSVGPEADRVPKLERVAVNWPGAIWKCGRSLVMCADATSREAMDTLLAGKKVTVAICDPPFGCKVDGFVSKKGKHEDFVQGAGEMDDAELLIFFRSFCLAMSGVLEPGALVYLFIDWRSLGLLQQAAESVFGKLINLCVWAKHRAGMGSLYRSQHELILVFAMPGAPHRNHVELGRHGRDRSNLWSWPSAASSRKGREGDMLKNHPTPSPWK